jgi:hypothetical protein
MRWRLVSLLVATGRSHARAGRRRGTSSLLAAPSQVRRFGRAEVRQDAEAGVVLFMSRRGAPQGDRSPGQEWAITDPVVV